MRACPDERFRLPTEEATHVVHALPILLFVYATTHGAAHLSI